MDWTNDAKWYIIGRLNEEKASELVRIHSNGRRFECTYFEREYMKLTETLYSE